MAAIQHTFRVGEIECAAVCDGTFPYSVEAFFCNVPREEVELELRARKLPSDPILTPLTCLLVRSGKERVLIDTGAGNAAPATGQLASALLRIGVQPQDITTVLLTHGHADHIGGVLDSEGQRLYPNARHLIARAEWEFWTGAPNFSGSRLDIATQQMLVAAAQKGLLPLRPVIELVEGEAEVAPGVRIVPCVGHTPGHFAVMISSGGESLIYVADAVLHPLHLEHPDWRPAFDQDPEEAARSRERLLQRAVSENATLHAYHFPFPGLGNVVRRDRGWAWEPTRVEVKVSA